MHLNKLKGKLESQLDEAEDGLEREKRNKLETDKARAELRLAAAELTVEATTRLLGRALTTDDQQRLVEEALKDAESVAP